MSYPLLGRRWRNGDVGHFSDVRCSVDVTLTDGRKCLPDPVVFGDRGSWGSPASEAFMGEGRRDWSPRGYWDDHSSAGGTRSSWGAASAIAVRPRRSAMGLLSLLVGSAALLVMLLASATLS